MTVTEILYVKSVTGFLSSSRVVLHTSWELEMVSGSPGEQGC